MCSNAIPIGIGDRNVPHKLQRMLCRSRRKDAGQVVPPTTEAEIERNRAYWKLWYEAERRDWERDHPGQDYPEFECGLSDREYTDFERWRRLRRNRAR